MKSVIYHQLTEEIYNSWKQLWEVSPFATYANSPYWFKTVVEHFDYKKFAVVAVYEKNSLVAVAGVVRVKKYGFKVYTLPPNDFVIGLPFLFDPSKKSIVQTLHDQLLTLGTIYLDNIPSNFIESFSSVSKNIDSYQFSINYYLPLELNEKGIIPFSYRKKIFRRLKEKKELFTIKAFDGTDTDILSTVFAIDSVSSKKLYGYNCFCTRFIKKFYTTLAKMFRDKMLVYILYYKNIPIAYDMGFFVNDIYYDNQSAYKAKYQIYNPGNVICSLMMDDLAKKGIKIIDFGSGYTFQKSLMTQTSNPLYKFTLSKNPLIRLNFRNVDKMKSGIYDQLQKRRRVYSLYRKMKKSCL